MHLIDIVSAELSGNGRGQCQFGRLSGFWEVLPERQAASSPVAAAVLGSRLAACRVAVPSGKRGGGAVMEPVLGADAGAVAGLAEAEVADTRTGFGLGKLHRDFAGLLSSYIVGSRALRGFPPQRG